MSPDEVINLNDNDAEHLFAYLRWGDRKSGPVHVTCPRCGGCRHYRLERRKTFKCSWCHRQFTVTSGTVFEGSKLKHQQMITALLAVQDDATTGDLAKRIGVTRKAAGVLRSKLIYAMLFDKVFSPPEFLVGHYQNGN